MRRALDLCFIDTNVLVDATDEARPGHRIAVDLLSSRDGLVLSAQVAREYLVVATRPVAVNGLGLDPVDALANLAEFRRAVRLLPEEKPLLPRLLELLREVPCRGPAIHDALVVATMITHGVRRLVTSNAAHFARFEPRVVLLEPARALAERRPFAQQGSGD